MYYFLINWNLQGMYCLIKLKPEMQHVYGKQAMGNPQAKAI